MRFAAMLMVVALPGFSSCSNFIGNSGPKVSDPVNYSGAVCESLVEGKLATRELAVLRAIRPCDSSRGAGMPSSSFHSMAGWVAITDCRWPSPFALGPR